MALSESVVYLKDSNKTGKLSEDNINEMIVQRAPTLLLVSRQELAPYLSL